MSGIAGLYRFDGNVNEQKIAEMTDAISHRGPDDRGTWSDGAIGLGHQRFHTTPESKYASPPIERNGKVLTADARIDNRAELLSTLQFEPDSVRISDEEIILAAYEEWGKRCPEYLVGAYAFAIWDPTKERLFVVRDHAGIRPFFYHCDDSHFAFGSEIRTLWPLANVPRELDEIRLSNFLSQRFTSYDRTFYENIRKIPPAHYILVTPDSHELEEYWSIDIDRELNLESDEAYAERFRELFLEIVRCRLRSVGPVGSTLSGGLDSSSIVAAANHLRDGEDSQCPLYTYSVVFDAEEMPKADEREYVQEITDYCDVTPRFVQALEHSPLDDAERVLTHIESPFIGSHYYLHWNMYKQAHEDEVRVILDGMGGDTTVSHGLGYLPELAAKGRWLKLARESYMLNERLNHIVSMSQIIKSFILRPLLPPFVWKVRARRKNDEFRDIVNPVLDPEFAERTELENRIFDNVASMTRTHRTRHLDRMLGTNMLQSIKRLSKGAASFPIKPRYPFFDRRLMEFCIALPPDQKIRNGWTRYVMRAGLDGILPDSIRWRGDKAEMDAGFWYSLRNHAMDEIDNVFSSKDLLIAEFIDMDRAMEVYEGLSEGEQESRNTFWYLTTLELWLRLEADSRAGIEIED